VELAVGVVVGLLVGLALALASGLRAAEERARRRSRALAQALNKLAQQQGLGRVIDPDALEDEVQEGRPVAPRSARVSRRHGTP
jgi:plasmid stabilization system protein ParE